tara:strand:+ start:183 stop:1973 length:1791 start_codon:yes stop_codon:yes gene_type:complete
MALPFLLGAARVGMGLLRGGAGIAKSGLRAAGSMGKGALGFGAGAAMMAKGGGQTAVPSSNEQSMDNVIPFPAASGGRGSGGGSSGGVSTAAATSALQDGDSSNPTVNALNDIREVLVNIKGDTATMAMGFSGPKAESPDENKLNAMFGGKGGGRSLPKGSAGIGAAVGGLTALGAMGLFDTETSEERAKEVQEKLEDGTDNFITKITQSLVTQGNKLIANKTLAGGALDAAKTGATALKNKVTAPKPGLDASGKPVIDSSKVVGTDPQGRNVVQSQKGNFTVQGADGKPTTQMVKPQDIKGAKIKIDAPAKAKTKGLAKAADLASSFLKNVGKYGIKQVPLVGAAAGLGMAAWRLMKGDKAGAAAELAGVALVGPVGGVTIDAGLLARDMYNDAYGDPDSDVTEEKFPHDSDAKNPMASGYLEKFGAIKDYVTGKLKEMRDNFGKSELEKPTDARPTEKGFFQTDKGLAAEQKRWDEKFGATHNEDGSLKNPVPAPTEMKVTETTGEDLIGASTPAEGESGSITIDGASNQVADAQAAASEEKAMQVASLQSGPLADLSNVVSGLGGKVEYLPVLVSDKSVVDAEVNSLMVQKNN